VSFVRAIGKQVARRAPAIDQAKAQSLPRKRSDEPQTLSCAPSSRSPPRDSPAKAALRKPRRPTRAAPLRPLKGAQADVEAAEAKFERAQRHAWKKEAARTSRSSRRATPRPSSRSIVHRPSGRRWTACDRAPRDASGRLRAARPAASGASCVEPSTSMRIQGDELSQAQAGPAGRSRSMRSEEPKIGRYGGERRFGPPGIRLGVTRCCRR